MPVLRFLGHACFELKEKETTILFDPFLTGNPWNIAKANDVNPNYILISHGHGDHLGDGVAIAKRTNATVISTHEIVGIFEQENCLAHGMHLGGKHGFDFGWVKVIPAFHGSGVPGGHAAGFLVNFFGSLIYFAGDTALFSDMALVGKLEKVDYALLPIGDNFTMGPQDAIEAAKLIKPRFVIPMHYNTWPIINQSADNFKTKAESAGLQVKIISPGEIIEL